jgi:hypothetical protein
MRLAHLPRLSLVSGHLQPSRLALPVLALAAVLAAAPAHAGTVNVSYAQNTQFTDAGATPWDRDTTMHELQSHLQALGQRYLPADRSLNIEVLDVDLAGETRPGARLRDVRVARGGADWPRITLRYSLQANGQTLRSGEETVSDMNYLRHLPNNYDQRSLGAEKRMLDEWFKQRFVASAD